MKQTKLLGLLTAVILLGLLVACGAPTGGPATQPTSAPLPTTAAAEPTAAPVPTEAPTQAPAATEAAQPTAEATTTEGTPTEDSQAVVTDTSYSAVDCEYGGLIRSIEALDDSTVKFTLCSPDVAFPSKVAFSAFQIHPSEHLEATGGGGPALIENPIGTGPYKLERWQKGDSLILTRNEDYWGERANAQTLVFRWQREGAARLLELQAGTVDGIDNPSPDDFDTIKGDASLTLYPRPALNVFYLGMNRDKAPFDNEKVRQAMAIALDRERIVDNFYPEGSEVATHFTPCAIPGGCEGEPWYDTDVEAAKALLTEAGFADGFTVDLAYRDVVRGYLPEPGLVAQDIQAQLGELGINVNITVMESGSFLDAADQGQLTMYLLGWGADYPDQTNFLDYHFGAGASPQFGAGFPDIHEVLKEAASLSDQDERNELYTEANNLIRQHVPMVPVAHGGSATAFKADVTGAHSSPLSNEVFSVVDPGGRDTLVWMQTPSRSASTARMRPTASRYARASRSTSLCWATRWAALRSSPRLLRATKPTTT
jgi:peptide/nickel transport system substrate-binding protein